jgi:hypothetical protein
MAYRLFGVFLLFFSPALVFAADVMFEGYYKVNLAGKHIGYAIQRYEFEPKAKTFRAISFLRVKTGDQIIQESLKATANDKFQPVSYQYTSQIGAKIATIDGSLKPETMILKKSDGKKLVTENHKIPKGTFFSSLLVYMLMQRPLTPGQVFEYSAIAEEEGASYTGRSLIESKEDKKEYNVYRILNSFKGEKFTSRMAVITDPKDAKKNIKAEVLGTESPEKNLSTELVPTPALATEGQMIPNKALVTLFGSMPTGKVNLLNKAK